MFFCNFLAAGPSVALVSITIDFFHAPPPTPAFYAAVAKAAYLFTTTALMQGMGNLVWMPVIIKYGRRPVYLGSFMLYTATAIWAGTARSYTSELVARIFMGLAAGSGECLAPLTIADIFFLHERVSSSSIFPCSCQTDKVSRGQSWRKFFLEYHTPSEENNES
jgi:MFS family permease